MNYIVVTFFVCAMTVSLSNRSYGESDHDHSEHSEKKEKGHGDDDHESQHGNKKNENSHDYDAKEDQSGHDHKEKAKNEEGHGHDEEKEGDDDGHSESNSSVGPDKAIIESRNEGQSFKLSKESEQFIGVQTAKINSSDNVNFQIQKNSLVEYQDKHGVFVKRNGWFELIPVTIKKRLPQSVLIVSHKIKSNDLIVVRGKGMLRAAHLQLTGQGGEGHAH